MEKLLVVLNVSTEELFANDHIKEPDELLADINSKIDSIKSDQHKLETIYKMMDFILRES